MALATSCISVLETTSNENSWAISSSLRRDHFDARRRREVKEIGTHRAAVKSGELEYRAVALAIGILKLLDQVRVRRDGQRDVANGSARTTRLQRDHDRSAARRLVDDEEPLAGSRVADEQKRQLTLASIVERRNGDLLVGGDVKPRVIAVENEDFF